METYLGTYYSTQNTLPLSGYPATSIATDADTRYMSNVAYNYLSTLQAQLVITIDTAKTAFRTLKTPTITATGDVVSGGKLSWTLSGTLVDDLGVK
jgi:hypothetical protein